MAELVVLGLGSNKPFVKKNLSCASQIILQPVSILHEAVNDLTKLFLPNTFRASSLYKSRAMYYETQDNFFNMAVSGFYENSAENLLHEINSIEAKFGRNRQNEIRNGPRTLDIDIELFGNNVIRTEMLEIPHKKLCERQFVLLPMLEILPKCADPISGTLYSEISAKLPYQEVARL